MPALTLFAHRSFPNDQNQPMSKLWAFLVLSRPHFLLGGAVMYAIGAVRAGAHDPSSYLLGQFVVSSIQVTAHFVNEYGDVEPDRSVVHRTPFSGGSGVLTTGRLSPQVALRAGIASTALAAVGIGAIAGRSAAAAAIAGLALVIAWVYSMPPARMLDTGWGELVTAIVVGALVPLVGALANGGSVDRGLWWVMGALVLLNLAVVVAFALPDLDTDRAAGKTVLAVRLGRRSAVRLLAGSFAAAAAISLVGVVRGAVPPNWLLAVPVLPGALTMWAAERSRYATLTTAAVLTVVSFGVAVLASS